VVEGLTTRVCVVGDDAFFFRLEVRRILEDWGAVSSE